MKSANSQLCVDRRDNMVVYSLAVFLLISTASVLDVSAGRINHKVGFFKSRLSFFWFFAIFLGLEQKRPLGMDFNRNTRVQNVHIFREQTHWPDFPQTK